MFSAQPTAAYTYTRQTCDAYTDWHNANSDWRGSANSIGNFIKGCAIGQELGAAATVAQCEQRCGGVYGRGHCCQCTSTCHNCRCRACSVTCMGQARPENCWAWGKLGYSYYDGACHPNPKPPPTPPPPAATCNDNVQNQGESGVDCGGPCRACPTCDDNVKNQDETGVDCGGSTCNTCPTCDDKVQNQDETGEDCGGSVCDACPTVADFVATIEKCIDDIDSNPSAAGGGVSAVGPSSGPTHNSMVAQCEGNEVAVELTVEFKDEVQYNHDFDQSKLPNYYEGTVNTPEYHLQWHDTSMNSADGNWRSISVTGQHQRYELQPEDVLQYCKSDKSCCRYFPVKLVYHQPLGGTFQGNSYSKRDHSFLGCVNANDPLQEQDCKDFLTEIGFTHGQTEKESHSNANYETLHNFTLCRKKTKTSSTATATTADSVQACISRDTAVVIETSSEKEAKYKSDCDSFVAHITTYRDWTGSANSPGQHQKGCEIGAELRAGSGASVEVCESRCADLYGGHGCCQCNAQVRYVKHTHTHTCTCIPTGVYMQ